MNIFDTYFFSLSEKRCRFARQDEFVLYQAVAVIYAPTLAFKIHVLKSARESRKVELNYEIFQCKGQRNIASFGIMFHMRVGKKTLLLQTVNFPEGRCGFC